MAATPPVEVEGGMMSETPIYRPPDVSLVGDDHVRLYRETAGREGYLWNGVPTLLLTTIGRRTGTTRTSALIYGQDGPNYLVVASKGGSPDDPLWYRNLVANPLVGVQVRDQRFEAEASTPDDSDRARLWDIVRAVWPNYQVYQTRTSRRIPVVVLRPLRKG
jgi:deazaflavin-dependent oxidoreductase (nitroreductase family)